MAEQQQQQQHSSHKTYRCHQGQNASAPVPSAFYGGRRSRASPSSGGGCGGGIFCASFKNGLFLTVSVGQDSANAAKTPHAATWESAAFVRQAAKGGRILAWRSSKKHRRFFIWNTKSPHSSPGRNDIETTSPSPSPPHSPDPRSPVPLTADAGSWGY